MKTNNKLRKRLTGSLEPNEQIGATVALGASVGPAGGAGAADRARAVSNGTSHKRRYLNAFHEGADLQTQFRYDLGEPLFTLTNQRALFHKPKFRSPPELIDAVPIEEISLQWADHSAAGLRLRLMAISFADERFLIAYTPLGSALRKKNSNDEADAIVTLLGDRAVEVEVPDF